ncbi:allophanate hydrolase [Humitalea rosea]|uniref:Allophanate hydrolase n=1 Tax=Humitalea rosea TaxID=990373 RepID=A0A2W7I665_9PROT|nr:allophanate hydrolase [Humitalea rosea]PZW42154.1 allophanate hydrolase [Humitalea rosea]
MNLTLPAITAFLDQGGSPVDVAEEALSRLAAWADPAMLITAVPAEAVLARAAALMEEGRRGRRLWGVPFVVKDNIAAAGLPMTAACPDFEHVPQEDAPAVARLLAAGAILLGKANLDQFATGLNGTRSPYGTPRNAFRPDLVPGGSSSGSASAVAAGICAFSLGTDTAGSGRVPAMAQQIVGLKPTLGLVPTRGVVPACRSLDCVSIFAHSAAEAAAVLAVIAGPDAADPYSRTAPPGWSAAPAPRAGWRIAVPLDEELVFDTEANAVLFEAMVARAKTLGATVEPVSIAPLIEVAKKLYDGAWVAERTAALRERVRDQPETLHPVTRTILEGGFGRSAVDAFDDFHAVALARLVARDIFAEADAILLPTAPGIPSLEAMAAAPIAANSRLGTYTNFVNLLDMAGLAVPAGVGPDGLPFGVTLLGPAFSDGALAALGTALSAHESLLFCIGAHMSGLPLNGQVTALGGRLVGAAATAPCYRLFDLGSRPGLLRDPGGAAIEGEIWALPTSAIGALLVQVPSPLGFGRVEMADGAAVLGFLAEAAGVAGAPEITALGGWRRLLASRIG